MQFLLVSCLPTFALGPNKAKMHFLIKFQEPAQETKKQADTSLEVKCKRHLRLNIVKIKNYGEKWQR